MTTLVKIMVKAPRDRRAVYFARYVFMLFFLLWQSFLSLQVFADGGIKPGEEKFTLSAGVFLPTFNTRLQINNTDLDLGDEIDVENDLGLKESETVFWFGGTWRFAPHHRVGVSYFQFKRDATKTLLKDIEIEDEVYPAGASLESEFKLQTIPITYYYTFRKRQNYQMSFSAGLHWMTLDLNIVGKADLGTVTGDGNVSASANAPMPLFGLEYEHYFNSRWTMAIHGEIFGIDLSDDTFAFSGMITNLSVNTIYYFIDNVGAGVALNWFTIDIDIKDDDWNGGFDYEYLGPQFFVTARF